MIDAFDAAAGQVKVETEGEKKIAESYQARCAACPVHLAALTAAPTALTATLGRACAHVHHALIICQT